MERIVIRHLSGSKANQFEIFLLEQNREILLGRDPAANVHFDPDRDDIVSRQHARISQDPNDETRFAITDLNSRNGTFVNRIRITGAAPIEPGDVIQLGSGGPELVFDLEPRPENLPRSTRVVAGPESAAPPPTREQRIEPTAALSQGATAAKPATTTVGRATVERMIAQTEGTTRKYLINTAAILGGVIALAIGVAVFMSKRAEQKAVEAVSTVKQDVKQKMDKLEAQRPISSTDIAEQYGAATVFIEASWKLILTDSGDQLYHHYDCYKYNKKKECVGGWRPVYIKFDNRVEPFLTPDKKANNRAIGSVGVGHFGSGFVVTDPGFILTNRHVAAAWDTAYQWPPYEKNPNNLPPSPAILVCLDPGCKKQVDKDYQPTGKELEQLRRWVPTKTLTLGGKPAQGKVVEGRNDFLDVTFPKTRLRIPARLVRVSDVHDVALIKIDVPETVKTTKPRKEDPVEPGDAVTVLGYPDVAGHEFVLTKSLDPLNREAEPRFVPIPTVTTGNIGKVIKGELAPEGGTIYEYYSEMGDVYQLTINTAGPGNSGGPVFNERGHVIGIFTYGKKDEAGTQISFAVPIKHGLDLMKLQQVIH